MKKIVFTILAAGLGVFFLACNQEDAIVPSTNEETLIEQIVNAPVVEPMGIADLVPSISGYVSGNYAPMNIEMIFHAPHLGCEVMLENGLFLYFDLSGHHLDHEGMHGDEGNHHGGGDLGVNHCMIGDTLNVEDLSQAILEYLSTNYSGVDAVTVILKPSGNLGVELSDGTVLMFDADGDFIHDCEGLATGGHGHMHGDMDGYGWHCNADMGGNGDPGGMGGQGNGNHGGMGGYHGGMNNSGTNGSCWGGTGITVDDLPQVISDYVNTNYPEVDIIHVMQTFGGNYFLRLSDCVRLVFDEEGNILFDSGE